MYSSGSFWLSAKSAAFRIAMISFLYVTDELACM